MTVRLTMAQALVRFLAGQYVERDGEERRFFAGCFGIFGHGNVAGIGQALLEYEDDLTYYQSRNEQAMVHTATAYARQKNRLQAFACTSSIGPGATNMVTGAALATINRLPVLLLPGDVFASRGPDPVLQQLEAPHDGDQSVNDAFRPVSKYWDRINRPEQIIPAALAAMRVLTNPAETGAVTLSLPQDVQAEAYDYPEEFFQKRVWRVTRPVPDAAELERAADLIRASTRPMIVSGGGTIYSEATEALRGFVERTGIPVGETQAGKGSMPYDHPLALGAVGATGTFAANRAARGADLVIGVGTRWSDFTTASKTAFQNPDVRFVNVNVADLDAVKHAGVGLVGDARATLEALDVALAGYEVEAAYREESGKASAEWDAEVQRLYTLEHEPLPAQSAVIGAVNSFSEPEDVVVCAAGSMPGDLHKLWRTRDPKGYHVEYGYSCMGYEISGGLGIKMAAPEREVYVMVGDGSYLMMSAEIITSVQEDHKLTIVLVDNSGFASIGALSRSVGTKGFGTQYRYRKNGSIGLDTEESPGETLPVDLATNAESLGAHVIRAKSVGDLKGALSEAKGVNRTVVIHIPVDRYEGVPDYESFWDVPVAEVSEMETVKAAREEYARNRRAERRYL
ncbi:3D-(3,5/4)-trihydroxycyclohexane-1,2-dione acylhydrolase (decyclizing) [Rubrobacter tropicus]|uniref:3D-(3,5/4)-trihydroxycyclohexane-1,2-dione acylhydrolase (Decyclizing) n=1 Tax=Rubrobacter tropicus TaxID=2653851 RepID=A0A6G8QCW2_9ACTN|nr:3D-(3,5/4)-trihydroxycyclohexane-1,2-dione acylhydrolase (decyclizing) [Rubrobacter tropicus]QIN84340.1 3D-(3,5/4)-trihydroxycyclohexane-1,2-dione acylhydrolase (decyclizing) [Rubrobacter tropicus]